LVGSTGIFAGIVAIGVGIGVAIGVGVGVVVGVVVGEVVGVGVGDAMTVGFLTATLLFQTNFLPDLMQVNFFP